MGKRRDILGLDASGDRAGPRLVGGGGYAGAGRGRTDADGRIGDRPHAVVAPAANWRAGVSKVET